MTVYANKPAFNVREKLKELEKPSGVAGNAMLRAETPQEQFNLIGAGRRNLIINGGFDVWQRGTSFISAGTGYAADRFRHLVYGGATPDITKVAGFGDFRNAIRYTGVDGSAGAQIEVEHRIEATSLPQTGNLTLSYWVRGSKAGSVRTGRIINGSTGATNTGYGSIEVSTEWSRVTVTVATLSATEAQYYRLFVLDSLLSYMSDNSVWLEMTGIQLEAGSVATPFEHRSYGEELALCQRFYQKVGNGSAYTAFGIFNAETTGAATCAYVYSQEMRAAPSASKGGAWQFFTGGITSSLNTFNGFNATKTTCRLEAAPFAALTVGRSYILRCENDANAFIAFDAEL